MDFVPKSFVRLSHRVAQWSAERMPRRRLRKWRYVSPRRHLIGLILLSALLGGIYGYWKLTNEASVRRMAGKYLQDLTGARVTVGEAHFDMFGGIRLGNINAYICTTDKSPFFRAPEVVLRHNPWSLLRGKLEITEVVLLNPEIIDEYNAETKTHAYQGMLADRRTGVPGGSLPTMTALHALYRRVTIGGDLQAEGEPTVGDASFVPTSDNIRYEIYLRQPDARIREPDRGQWIINMITGEIEYMSLVASTETFGQLSGWFDDLRDQYQISGKLRVVGGTQSETQGPMELELINISMTLPPEQGGLTVNNVRGKITFKADAEGAYNDAEFHDVTGTIAQSKGGTLTLSGHAGRSGEVTSFDVSMEVRELIVPETNPATGALGDIVESIFAEYKPQGAIDATLHAAKGTDGKLSYSGEVRPVGMAVTYKHFPAPVRDVAGVIRFDDKLGVHDIDLTGLRGGSVVNIKGSAARADGLWAYDITLNGINSPFDAATRDALPEDYAKVWDALAPSGAASVLVHATRDDQGQRDLSVELILNGWASITYEGFPYRIEDLLGRATLDSRGVHIDRSSRITGGNGAMRCRIYGDITDVGKPSAVVDLTIDVTRLPLDEQLLAALPANIAEVARDMELAGLATNVRARVVDSEETPLDFNIQASVADVSFRLDELPQAITDGVGEISIEPGRIIVKKLAAAHGPTRVVISGQMFVNEDHIGVDVNVEAPEVNVDEQLLAMLPEEVQSLTRKFAPAGRMGVSIWLQQNLPDTPADDYRVVLTPKGMALRYEGFPYTLPGVRGKVVVTPGRAELTDLTARAGDMFVTINGVIDHSSGLSGKGLSLTARNMPMDEEFLAAIPSDLRALAGRFRPGGTCDIDISRLDFRRAAPTPDQPHPQLLWYAEGSFGMADAVVSLGLSDKAMSGQLTGKLARNEDGLAIKGDLHFDSIHIGDRELTDVDCQITKAYSSTMLHLDNFIGHTHGGKLIDGFAEIDLSDPLEYGIQMSVENVDLNDLLNAGVAEGEDRNNITGLLTGRLELIAVADDPTSRRASGVLLISDAAMVRMPVVLGMMNVMSVELPGDAMFTQGILLYSLNGNTLVFEEIHLTGPTRGLLGSGTMDMQTEQLALTFLAGPPDEMPRLLGLEELLEHVVSEIVEIQITGTLSDPITSTVPFSGAEDVLNKLLRPVEE